MKYFVLLLTIFLVSCTTFAEIPSQEKFRSHRVQEGETVYSLAKKYDVTERAIYRLNPDAKKGIGLGSIIILPSNSSEGNLDGIKFKNHKVKRKETLFSISQKYGVSVDEIKKYNKHLYAKGLKKGEKLRIPLIKKGEATTVVTSSETGNTGNTGTNTDVDHNTHTIQAKETKYGIARKYGISISELEAMNPEVASNFPIGTVLKVPNNAVIETATIEDESFGFYEVQAKEGFYRLKVKLGLTEEEIITLNPYAKDGLKEGMILKVPKGIANELSEETNTVNLEDRIANRANKRLAIMLPFQLKKIDKDTIDGRTGFIKNNRTARIALDFYSGVLMAAEFAKDQGLSVELDVYDTEGTASATAGLLAKNNFGATDAVIGPLLSKNVEKAASLLKGDNVPVFSPLTSRNLKLTSNLFQTLPSDELLEVRMIEYIKENVGDHNVLIISDSKRMKQKNALMAALPNAKTLSPREEGFLYVVDIDKKLDKVKENWVILETADPVIISNVVGLLNGMPETSKIRLFTTDKNDNFDFDDISNMHLANLEFTFPSVSKSYDHKDKSAFIVSYKNKYNVLPNRYAVRGFDVTYDVLLRLAAGDDVYDTTNNDFETEYVENKFRYNKKPFSGYKNNAYYILKYNKDLRFEVVK